MSRFFRVRVFRAGIVAMGVLVTIPVTLLGIAEPAGAASAAAATTHPIDHLLCYITDFGAYTIPTPVTLQNQFNTTGFQPTISSRPAVHCNPVQKTVPGKVFKITHKAAHELCFPITAPTQQTPNVIVSNQFGQATLATGQPTRLCLPTWKSLTGPPNKTPSQPSGLDHLTCYPVQYIPGGGTFTPPAPISLMDQFGSTQVQVSNPVSLCVPTTKTANGVVYKMHFPTQHLLCFQVTQTPIKPFVYDQNQFGTQTLAIRYTALLCLPSTKTIVKTVTSTGGGAQPVTAHVGQAVMLTGTVTPPPDGGTVGFTDGGTTISGCGAQPVDTSTGQATCQTTFSSVGTHSIVASYSGDALYTRSHSMKVKVVIT